MAVNPCKECGAPVSDKAESCPQCGAKQPKKTSKLAIIFAGLVLLFIFIGIFSGNKTEQGSSGETKERQKWFVETDTDPMTDKKRVYVSLLANNALMKGNDWSTLEEPMITFRCENNTTDFLIDFKQPLSPEYGNALRRTTKFRLDDKAAFNVSLNTAQGNLRVYFVSNPVPTIKKIAGNNKMLVSYQAHRQGEQVLEFDISELENRIKPVREACNW